ncbi:hypothetical protein [Nocardioides lijunqiniae]|uniref:hypothetical protein n=1 Tax=Nocardioides lijunqiniae TaxID=2760832 RepID=UPI001878148E|nr:hypothetical protein [Nocardioides lijunqiniae]
MTVFQVNPADMASASGDVGDAADGAQGHGSSEHLDTAGAAIPGADSARYLADLGISWDEDVEAWADSVRDFGDQIESASREAQGADDDTGWRFGGLFRGLGEG